MAAARPRRHRPGRLGPRLPLDPAPVGVLRGEARDRRIHRFPSLRADPRRQSRQGDDGQHAGAEHAAVRLGRSRLRGKGQPVPPIFEPEVAARAILLRGRAPAPRAPGRTLDVHRAVGPEAGSRPARLVPREDRLRGAADRPSRKSPTDPTISRRPLTPPSTTARTAASTDGPKGGAPRSSWRSTADSRSRPPPCLGQWRRSRPRGSFRDSPGRRARRLLQRGRFIGRASSAGAEYSSSPTGSPQSVSAPSSPAS